MGSLAEVLKNISEKYPELLRMYDIDLAQAWKNTVGETISAVSISEKVLDGLLFVIVRDPVWANQLNIMKKEILDKLNLELKDRKITDIVFKVGQVVKKQNNKQYKKKWLDVNVPDDIMKQIVAAVECVRDKELAGLMIEVFKRSYVSADRSNWEEEQ